MHGATARGALRATLRAGKGKKPRLGAIQTAATPTDGTLAQGLPPLRDNNTQGGEGGGEARLLEAAKAERRTRLRSADRGERKEGGEAALLAGSRL